MVSEALGKPVGRSTIAKIENKMYEPRYSVAVKIFEILYQKISETRISEVEAKDIMTREVEVDETLYEVWLKMRERAFSQFPVKKKGKIVGSITEKRIN